jgi:propanediol utilization protein
MINKKVPIEVSARHIHLTKKDFEKLFGNQNPISPIKKLSQEGEFAAEEKISLVNKDKRINNVRVLGPFRKNSQVEIALTDAYHLKLNPLPKIKVSGDLANTTKILVRGPKEQLKIPCIIAQRHLHCSETEAKKLKIKNNQIIKVKILGKRGLIFENIIVRTNPKYRASVHLDTDEGNSAGISGKTFGEIVK